MVTDKDDHIWVLNRPRDINPDESGAASNPPRTDCCVAAPAVLEFDTAGNLLRSWGAPGYNPGWAAPGIARPGAAAEHNIIVDRQGNVWIGGSNRGDGIQKYTADGKFLWDFGHRGPYPQLGPARAARPAKQSGHRCFPQRHVLLRPGRGRAGDLHRGRQARPRVRHGQRRVQARLGRPRHSAERDRQRSHAALRLESGPPPDQKQFAPALHCVHFSVDGLVYVCERGSNRIQVFTKQGKFVTQLLRAPVDAVARRSAAAPAA